MSIETPKTQIEQAGEDLADINALRKEGSGFQRYYLRRLNNKIDYLKGRVLYDRKLKDRELEELRNQLWALEELRDMPEQDYRHCLKLAESVG